MNLSQMQSTKESTNWLIQKKHKRNQKRSSEDKGLPKDKFMVYMKGKSRRKALIFYLNYLSNLQNCVKINLWLD